MRRKKGWVTVDCHWCHKPYASFKGVPPKRFTCPDCNTLQPVTVRAVAHVEKRDYPEGFWR